jgi:hypothetical protein
LYRGFLTAGNLYLKHTFFFFAEGGGGYFYFTSPETRLAFLPTGAKNCFLKFVQHNAFFSVIYFSPIGLSEKDGIPAPIQSL